VYIMRLDDASEYWNSKNWRKMHELLTRYDIKPILAIIPQNEDPELKEYGYDPGYSRLLLEWISYGAVPAIHGYNHVFVSEDGGMNPVNSRSEFAGVDLEKQRKKVHDGIAILKDNGINPIIFIAPAHTFDLNTLAALKLESDIRIISDTIATDVYFENDFYFIPQQTGRARKLPFKVVTFCYHPNVMEDDDFDELEIFLKQNRLLFGSFDDIELKKRKLNIIDKGFRKLYFFRHKLI